MVRCNWFFIGLIILLSGCREQSEPKLELEGHWVVDHGFDDDCQVTASFFGEDMMALSFYSLVDDACQSEFYGIESYTAMTDLNSRKDYFNEEGNLAVDFQFREHTQRLGGNLSFAETAAGLSGTIVSAENGSTGLLNPLLNTPYILTALPEDWFSTLRGAWGEECLYATDGRECEALEFLSETIGRYGRYGQCNANLICNKEYTAAYFLYALRYVEKLSDDQYRLELVIYGPGSDARPAGSPASVLVSPERLEMIGLTAYYPLTRYPVVSAQ